MPSLCLVVSAPFPHFSKIFHSVPRPNFVGVAQLLTLLKLTVLTSSRVFTDQMFCLTTYRNPRLRTTPATKQLWVIFCHPTVVLLYRTLTEIWLSQRLISWFLFQNSVQETMFGPLSAACKCKKNEAHLITADQSLVHQQHKKSSQFLSIILSFSLHGALQRSL